MGPYALTSLFVPDSETTFVGVPVRGEVSSGCSAGMSDAGVIMCRQFLEKFAAARRSKRADKGRSLRMQPRKSLSHGDRVSPDTSDGEKVTSIIDLNELRLTRQIWAAASPTEVYDLISDVSAMPKWSPNLVHAEYDNGYRPTVGAWFSGRNKADGIEWDTRLKIVSADPGACFAWSVVSDGSEIVTWSYTFRSENAGTTIEESWQVKKLIPPLGTTREELLQLRTNTARSMEATLSSLAESIGNGNR